METAAKSVGNDVGKEVSPAAVNDEVLSGVELSRFTVKWMLLITIGVLIEFFARFIGYEPNPLFFMPFIPALTSICALFIILLGYMLISRGGSKRNIAQRRDGIMTVILGLVMIVSFYLFKQVMPILF